MYPPGEVRGVFVVGLGLLVAGCAEGAAPPFEARDAGGDASLDARDADADAVDGDAADTSADTGGDVTLDVAGDAADAPLDAPADSPTDVGADVAAEAAVDGAVDASADHAVADASAPVSIGVYQYDAVAAYGLVDPKAAAWHPSGDYALVLNATDAVYRYDPAARSLTKIASVGATVSWRAVSFVAGGATAVLLGNVASAPEGRVYLYDHAAGTVALMAGQSFAGGSYEALAVAPEGGAARLLGQKPNGGGYLAYVWPFDPASGRGSPAATATSAGCTDLGWATDAFGAPAQPIACGTNGGELLHVDGSGAFVVEPASVGNTARLSARPQGDYALAVGWSSGSLFRFERGVWETHPSIVPVLDATFAVSFATDGRRALVLGGLSGTEGTLFEYRHALYDRADIVSVSIPNLNAAPYAVSDAIQLHAAAWRPGCEGGILVGGSSTLSYQKALVIRFAVTNGIACPN